MRIGVIGAGIVGSTFAVKLQEKGYSIVGVNSKTMASAGRLGRLLKVPVKNAAELVGESDIVLVATPDRIIQPLICELQEFFHPGQTVIHFSGSLSSDIMDPVRKKGAKALSIHPLQAFASMEVALEKLAGTHFIIEGDDLSLGLQFTQDLGGIPHSIYSEHKTLYHAGACVASNYLVVLADIAVELLEKAGFQRGEALSALLPLMQGTLANLEKIGLPKALTGPVARGDYPVIVEHLGKIPENIEPLYRQLGLWALDIAMAKDSISQENKKLLQRVLALAGGEH